MSHTSADFPLWGIKVLDLSIERAGPVAVRLLADWGAEVIRIEPTPAKTRGSVTGRRRAADEQNLHRNKKCLAVDLKSAEGAEILRRLVLECDVVVENFRSAVKERLGLSIEQLHAVNPRIILASISGFGQDGPYSDRPAFDQIVQGMCGLASVTGEPGRGPMRVGIAISDTSAGMFLGQGILLALLHRNRTGKGQWVHTSLLEAMMNKLDFQGARYTVDGDVPVQQGNSHPTAVPMNTYEASDGWVNLAASSPKMWTAFCEAIGARELFEDPEYVDVPSRAKHRTRLDAEINELTRTLSTDHLVRALNAVGVPCGPVYTIPRAFNDPQVKHLRVTRPVSHPVRGELELLRSPINLSDCPHPERFDLAAPDSGQQSREILERLGFGVSEIEEMVRRDVVA